MIKMVRGYFCMNGKKQPSKIESILIVDDSPVQRAHAAKICRDLGISLIHEASDGLEALKKISTLDTLPSLMILDLEMPGMDGIELVETLRQRELAIPVILASSREASLIDSVAVMERSILVGLHKPLTHAALQGALLEFSESTNLKPQGQLQRTEFRKISRDELSNAIRDRHIQPHFQPKVDMLTGILRGAEALARWNHPILGMVPPDEFIPLIEREGLIHELTLSIMDQVFSQCSAWNSKGLRLAIAVNLSPTLLINTKIVQEICDALTHHDLQPGQVVLEVTEGSVVDSGSAAPAVLARLRLKGFSLAIDDYGTGFSSLQQLSRIPFTELKIDRSFVHGAHKRKNLRVILESALDLARKLGLSTVAEGVETIEDWRLLQQFGCNAAQGWLIGKAMPGSELPAWAKCNHQRLRELRTITPA